MAITGNYPAVPRIFDDVKGWAIKAGDVINNILLGRLNITTSVTLTANAASTTVTDPRISSTSRLILVPTTENASAEIGNGTIYQATSGRVNGSRVITHANNAQTDRTFDAIIIG